MGRRRSKGSALNTGNGADFVEATTKITDERLNLMFDINVEMDRLSCPGGNRPPRESRHSKPQAPSIPYSGGLKFLSFRAGISFPFEKRMVEFN